MNHVPIRLGPLALLLSVISICLTVLGVLTLSTAQADMALAERNAATVRTRYILEEEGQRYLMTARPGSEKVIEHDTMRLRIVIDKDGHVSRWTLEKDWDIDHAMDGLWTGN